MEAKTDASEALNRHFTNMRDTPSQVNMHMDTITQYALKSSVIVEYGMGRCEAMLACLNALPEVYRGYDTQLTQGQITVAAIASQLGVNIHLHEESSASLSKLEMDEPVDMVVLSDSYWDSCVGLLDDLSMVHTYIVITQVPELETADNPEIYQIEDFAVDKYIRPANKYSRSGLVVYKRKKS